MRSAPFSRFRAIMSVLAAALAAGVPHMTALETSGAGSYRSRGKGLGRYTTAHAGTVAQAKRAVVKAKNRAANRRNHRG